MTTAEIKPFCASGECSLRISAKVPTDIGIVISRSNELGLPSLHDRIQSGIADREEVKRWRTLDSQIKAAEKKVRDCQRAVEKATALKAALEHAPIPDLAEALRKAEAESQTATAAKAQAEADLQTIRYLIPRTWAAAANAAVDLARSVLMRHVLDLSEPEKAATARLEAACELVEKILVAAIAEHIQPAAEELLATSRAKSEGLHGHDDAAQEHRRVAIGYAPAGVRPNRIMPWLSEEVPPPGPPAPVKEPEPNRPIPHHELDRLRVRPTHQVVGA